jgi:hypothetical protein
MIYQRTYRSIHQGGSTADAFGNSAGESEPSSFAPPTGCLGELPGATDLSDGKIVLFSVALLRIDGNRNGRMRVDFSA